MDVIFIGTPLMEPQNTLSTRMGHIVKCQECLGKIRFPSEGAGPFLSRKAWNHRWTQMNTDGYDSRSMGDRIGVAESTLRCDLQGRCDPLSVGPWEMRHRDIR